MTTTELKRVATYERVSSDVQRDKETIRTQSEALAHRWKNNPNIKVGATLVDDGVCVSIQREERPED